MSRCWTAELQLVVSGGCPRRRRGETAPAPTPTGGRRRRVVRRASAQAQVLTREHEVRVAPDLRPVESVDRLPPAADAVLGRDLRQVVAGLDDVVRTGGRSHRGRRAHDGGLLRRDVPSGRRPDLRARRARRALRGQVLGRRVLHGRGRSGVGRARALAVQPELGRAGRPGAPALRGEDALGDGDLRAAAGLVGARGVGGAAERAPGRRRELQAAGEAVAGVDRPVAARLASGDPVPGGAGGRVGPCRR